MTQVEKEKIALEIAISLNGTSYIDAKDILSYTLQMLAHCNLQTEYVKDTAMILKNGSVIYFYNGHVE